MILGIFLVQKFDMKRKIQKMAKTNNIADIEFTIGINKVLYKIKYITI
jgi:hypothetical protein